MTFFDCVECGESVGREGVKIHTGCLVKLWIAEAKAYNLPRLDILKSLLESWIKIL